MRLRMNPLTNADRSVERSMLFSRSLSVAMGSRPLSIGRSYFFLNSDGVPSTPGLQKSTIEKNSWSWFCSGVPDNRTLLLQCMAPSALLVSVWSFFRRCASSQRSKSHVSGFSNLSACILNVS